MNNEQRQRIALISTMNEIVDQIRENEVLYPGLYEDLNSAFVAFGVCNQSRLLELIPLLQNDTNAKKEYIARFDCWCDSEIIAVGNSTKTSDSYKCGRLGCDREFLSYVKTIKSNTLNSLVDLIMGNLASLKQKNIQLYNQLTTGYRGWYFENNWLDGFEGSNNSLVSNRARTLKLNIEKIEWLYDNLEDNLSRMTLNAIINHWLSFTVDEMLNICIYTHEAVDNCILPFYEDEVFVDCGSYIGDTVAEYVNTVNSKYKRIYTYEISKSTVEVMRNNLKSLSNVVYNTKGVGDKPGWLDLLGSAQPFEGNKLVYETGNARAVEKVEVVRLDDDLPEPITFLKIDVEGLDKEALTGSKDTIRKYHPKIQVDSYHKLVDFFEVPLLINSIDPTYRFYLRISSRINDPLKFPRPSIYAL